MRRRPLSSQAQVNPGLASSEPTPVTTNCSWVAE